MPKLPCVMRMPFANAMFCTGVETTAAGELRAHARIAWGENTSTMLTRVMRITAASAMHCMGVETAAAAGRRTESVWPEEHEEERRGEVDARDEDDLRECDVISGVKTTAVDGRRAESARLEA